MPKFTTNLPAQPRVFKEMKLNINDAEFYNYLPAPPRVFKEIKLNINDAEFYNCRLSGAAGGVS